MTNMQYDEFEPKAGDQPINDVEAHLIAQVTVLAAQIKALRQILTKHDIIIDQAEYKRICYQETSDQLNKLASKSTRLGGIARNVLAGLDTKFGEQLD